MGQRRQNLVARPETGSSQPNAYILTCRSLSGHTVEVIIDKTQAPELSQQLREWSESCL
jgi:hypothetical protein